MNIEGIKSVEYELMRIDQEPLYTRFLVKYDEESIVKRFNTTEYIAPYVLKTKKRKVIKIKTKLPLV
jgi:hypothetical protein